MNVKIKFEAPTGPRPPFETRYPFAEMEVGDGMSIPARIPLTNVKLATHSWGKRHGRSFEHQVIDGQNVIVRLA